MNQILFVTGYFGAPIRETAKALAGERGWDYFDLDRAIEERDGRSIVRICMAAGEHGYRNQEYEIVEELAAKDGAQPLVVACGDGVLYDDETRQLIQRHELVIAGSDMNPDELWARAREEDATWHAFMMFGDEKEKEEAFRGYYLRQKTLFSLIEEGDEK